MSRSTPLSRASQILALAAAYAVVGRLGLKLDAVAGFATLVWPPTGIALAALLGVSQSLWPGVALGAFAVNLWVGGAVPVALGIAAGNTLEAVIGAFLIRKLIGRRSPFEGLREVLAFIFFGAVLAPLVSAAVGVATLWFADVVSGGLVSQAFSAWWLGDLLGALVLAPALLLTIEPRKPADDRPTVVAEVWLSGIAIVATAAFVFGPFTAADSARAFFLFPLLLWVAVRLGPRAAAFSSLLTSAIAVAGTTLGYGPFARPSLVQSLVHLQSFMAVAAVTTLVLACVVRERDRALAAHTRSERQASFVARVSALFGESLELDATLHRVASLLVPELADWCTICLAGEEDSRMQRVAVVHHDPAKAKWVEAYRRAFPPGEHATDAVTAILASGKSSLLPVVPAEAMASAAQSPEHLAVMQGLGVSSAILVPIIAHSKPIGVISLLRSTEGRRYGRTDLELAEEFARRAGLAIDNARLYEQAQRTIGSREEILAVVSHDLKNPLAAILSRVKLMERKPPPGQEETWVGEQAAGVRRSVKQMTTLIDGVLGAEIVGHGKIRLHRQAISAGHLVAEVVEDFAASAKARGIHLSAVAEDGKMEVAAEPQRVTQILSNLLGNALKYTPRGGTIDVSISPGSGEVWFEVKDTGPGIPQTDQPHVFDRYWRGRDGGTGLGLFIVKQLVEAHGGTVRLQSDSSGSRFSFSLPTKAPEAAPVEP